MRRFPGHDPSFARGLDGWSVRCVCSWRHPESLPSSRAARDVYRQIHVESLRSARRLTCRLCRADLTDENRAQNAAAGNLCRSCLTNKARKWHTDNPERGALLKFESLLKKKYGISLDDYDTLKSKQGNRCAICGSLPGPSERGGRLHIDHDHETGIVRGLLCYRCNNGLGNFRDFVPFLRSASVYLTAYRESCAVEESGSELFKEINYQLREVDEVVTAHHVRRAVEA